MDQSLRLRKILVTAAISLFVVMAGFLFWFFVYTTGEPSVGIGWYVFSFAAGLSMIVLPCTLPLAFVIVPLSMGKGPAKGFAIALAFGTGVALMLSVYGIAAAAAGKAAIDFFGTSPDLVKNWLYFIAGTFAYIFALGEIGLLSFRMPTYSGAFPGFIQRQGDVFKALLLGLFLGNVGVGCPHPATPTILTRIAVSGDIFYGWLLFFVHAVGRVIPLLFLALLGIVGVNALEGFVKRKDKIERATGWGMVFVAAFILVLGLFTHDWWVYSGTHSLLESVTQEERFVGIISENLGREAPHTHGLEEIEGHTGLFGLPLWLGSWVLVALWLLPIWWNVARAKKSLLPPEQDSKSREVFAYKKRSAIFATLLIAVVFLYTIPQWFRASLMSPDMHMDEDAEFSVRMERLPSELVFFLQDKDGRVLSDVVKSHKRFFHVIVVSEDFEFFAHTHPDDFASVEELAESVRSGVFRVPFEFPQDGRYLIAVDFEDASGHEGVAQFITDVGERGTPTLVKDFARKAEYGGYTAALNAGEFRAGELSKFSYTIEKDGVPVTDLEEYLGAPMHVAIVSADLSTFIHTHGMVAGEHELAEGEFFGPKVDAEAVFPYPGIYQIFGQFAHDGEVVLTRFLVEVGKGTVRGQMAAPHGH